MAWSSGKLAGGHNIRFDGTDRFQLWLMGVWAATGGGWNYLRFHPAAPWLLPAAFILWVCIVSALAASICYSTVRRRRTLADYGFCWRRGALICLPLAAAVVVYSAATGAGSWPLDSSAVWRTAAAVMEEIGFRAILISLMLRSLKGVRAAGFWAVLGSSIFFTLPHAGSKTFPELQGIFTASLVLGLIYYKSGSLVLPAWAHAASNAGAAGGLLAVVLCCVLAIAGSVLCSKRHRAREVEMGCKAP